MMNNYKPSSSAYSFGKVGNNYLRKITDENGGLTIIFRSNIILLHAYD